MLCNSRSALLRHGRKVCCDNEIATFTDLTRYEKRRKCSTELHGLTCMDVHLIQLNRHELCTTALPDSGLPVQTTSILLFLVRPCPTLLALSLGQQIEHLGHLVIELLALGRVLDADGEMPQHAFLEGREADEFV